MSEPAPTPSPSPAPAPAPSPAPADAPAVAARPEWLPEAHWDDKTGAIKTEDFGKHYGETVAKATKLDERMAAIPAKPEDYKIELKLPDDVKLPDGVKFDPSKDPRTPHFLKVAREIGLTNAEVSRIVSLDAQLALAEHTAETARVAEEKAKLGEKATDRIAAATNWLKGQTGEGKTFTESEAGEIRLMVGSAAGVTALEKLMGKINGTVPGHVPSLPEKPAPKTLADAMWPSMSERKAS